MSGASIPVDLSSPGQVFACLGFMEAAEILCGTCFGHFVRPEDETVDRFEMWIDDNAGADPVDTTIRFFLGADVKIIVPDRVPYDPKSWKVPALYPEKLTQDTEEIIGVGKRIFPGPTPKSDICQALIEDTEHRQILIDHWADGSSRDQVKFWAGAAGMPGAAIAARLLDIIKSKTPKDPSGLIADPFSFAAPVSSGFRFDWRRDTTAIDAGFSLDTQTSIRAVGYPLVELLAAIGLQHARPHKINRLEYRYGVWTEPLPTMLARAVLGAQPLALPKGGYRQFHMTLDWPGQEGQARRIKDCQEDFEP